MSRLLNQERAELIVYNASKVYGVNPMQKNNERLNVWCRTAISVILKKEGNTFQAIGDFLYKNHATIHHGINRHPDDLIYDKVYKSFYDEFVMAMRNPETSITYVLKTNRSRIKEVVLTLKALGYDEQGINTFFEECIEETKLKIA